MMLKNKVILITGASRGIGAATAKLLSKHGAKIILNYNNSEEQAQNVAKAITANGNDVSLCKADLSNEDEVKDLFNFIWEKYGKIDVLINNAGIMKNNLIPMTKTSEYEQVINTNCRSLFLCTRYFTKLMMKQKSGKIINTASIVGVYGNSGQTVYSASKAFVIGYTKAAAKELGRYGITVNAIAPGFIETDMTKNTSAKVREDLLAKTALGRFGTPEDVAKVMLFLSSDLSDYVSGQVIGVDGCETM